MSKDPHAIPKSVEVCVLFSTASWRIISIQAITLSDRVCTNSMSWMKRASRRWYTLSEFSDIAGVNRHDLLYVYNPALTWENYEFQNNELIL